ncbi:hypothetical protein [Gimesia sp.]|uniref:hypothetical protein n=1 Tax=Gimesia sp. TaxID=2024833 RepID=UPI003A90E07F
MSHKPVPPTGPYHDFWIFAEGSRAYADYGDLAGRKDAPVRVPDDVLRYFHDWFNWVPTLNPALNSEQQAGCGLNYYGPTIVNRQGAEQWERILLHLKELYQGAPDRIHLTGLWTVDSADLTHAGGYYEVLEIEKSWLIEVLSLLHEFARQASIGSHFVLHLGV